MKRDGENRRRVAGSLSLALVFVAGCKQDPNVRKQKYLESGIRFENSGKLNEAASQFSNALKVDRNYSDAHYELAKTYLKMGETRAGQSELVIVVDENPNNFEARIQLGRLELGAGSPEEAEQQARVVLAVEPNNADAFALLSDVSASEGKRAEALEEIERALTIDPNRSAFHTQLGMLESGDAQGTAVAEQEMHTAMQLDPKDPNAPMMLAALLEKKGDLHGAEEQELAAIRIAPKNLSARASLAGVYRRAGDRINAERTLRKAVEDLPDSDDAANLLSAYYVQDGLIDHAEIVFEELSASYPKSAAIRLAYARVLISKNDYGRASQIADQVRKIAPDDPDYTILNATLLIHSGRGNEAFEGLQAAAKKFPENAALQVALGKVARLGGDIKTAEMSFRRAAVLQPGSVEAQEGLAEIANSRGDSALLTQVAETTIALHPGYSDGYVWRGTAEANQSLYDKAEADFQTAIKLNPNNAAALTELGQLRLREQHASEGTALLEEALTKDANAKTALQQLVAYVYTKQPAMAMARLQEQVKKAPESSDVRVQLATMQLSRRDFSGASASAQKGMELDPANREAVQVYAQAEFGLGHQDGAIHAWEGWISGHPKDAEATSMVGLLEEASGDQAKAMTWYRRSLELDPEQGLAANNLAYLMVQTGQNVDAALALAMTARRREPNSANTADTLGWVYFHKGTYPIARDLLESALKDSPENASINYHLGMTYLKLGNKADAAVHLKKAVALAPKTQIAKDAGTALAEMG